MKTPQSFTLALSLAMALACTLNGYVLKANFPEWTGKQWQFWAIGISAGILFLLVVTCSRPA